MNETSALLIIDVQKAFDDEKWGERNNLSAEKNISKILDCWREQGWVLIHIQHISNNPESVFHPNHEGHAIKELVRPLHHEAVITKSVNSAFIGTNLEEYLKLNGIKTVVITGMTTPHCVSTTTRMSSNLGFNTFLIEDATAAFAMKDKHGQYYDAETIHRISLLTLDEEFATVITTNQLLRKF